MPGILDFLNTPDAQLGIGLLAAGGPTTDPNQTGLGQRVAGAMQSTRTAQQQQQQLAMQQAQIANLNFSLKKNQLLYDTAAGLTSPDPQSAAPNVPTMGGPSGAPQSGPPMGGPQGGGVPPQQGMPGSLQMAPQGSPQGSPQGAPVRAGGMFGNIPNKVAAFSMLTDPNALNSAMLAQYALTDTQKQLVAAGYQPGSPQYQQAMMGTVNKAIYIAPTRLGEGAYAGSDGQVRGLPTTAPKGYVNIANPNDPSGWSTIKVGGGLDAVAEASAAEKTGVNRATPSVGYAPGTNMPIPMTVDQKVQQANGVQPGGVATNNNPGNLRPPGASTGFQSFPTPEAGLAALDGNLKSYATKGINTIEGVINRWAPPSENNTAAYVSDVSKRLGIAPNQPIDLNNPIVRQAMSTAITIHENGSRILTGPAQAQAQAAGGPLPELPAGASANANAAQQASAQTMHESYAKLQAGNASAQGALEGIDKMMNISSGKNSFLQSSPLMAGPMGTIQTAVSAPAAEYEKQRANVISLIAAQNGTNGTDAGRALTGESVPEFGKPKDAQQDGLQTLKNQVIASTQMKTDFLTKSYQAGDSKMFTQLSNDYDKNVSPSMVPILTMPAGQSRAMLINSMRQKPGMEAKLNWAVENGLLK